MSSILRYASLIIFIYCVYILIKIIKDILLKTYGFLGTIKVLITIMSVLILLSFIRYIIWLYEKSN